MISVHTCVDYKFFFGNFWNMNPSTPTRTELNNSNTTDATTASPAVLPNNFSVLGEVLPVNNGTDNDAAVLLDVSIFYSG